MRKILVLCLSVSLLFGCAAAYKISEHQSKDDINNIYACCIDLKRPGLVDASTLQMHQLYRHSSKLPYSLGFVANWSPFGAIQPARLGKDAIIVTVYLDGVRYGQIIATDKAMMKMPTVIVPEEFYQKLATAESVVITYIVGSSEKFISKYVAQLDKDTIQKMLEFYRVTLTRKQKGS
jgi:hypothetical protein